MELRIEQFDFGWTDTPCSGRLGRQDSFAQGGVEVKPPVSVRKLAVLGSSLLLVGGCVSYHSGAFNRFNGAKPKSSDTAADSASPPMTVIGGTKSPSPRGVMDVPSKSVLEPDLGSKDDKSPQR
jgi:hypothetical protein